MGLTRMAMTQYLRDLDLARRVFARAEMRNNSVGSIIAGAGQSGQLTEVDPNYATELLTVGAKAFFFWPKFLIGADNSDKSAAIIDDCVDMFLMKYQARP